MSKSLLRKAYKQYIKACNSDINNYEAEYTIFMNICISISKQIGIYWGIILEQITIVVKQQKDFNTLIKILKLLGVNYE